MFKYKACASQYTNLANQLTNQLINQLAKLAETTQH